MEYADIYDANNLFDAYRKAKRGSAWKESVQRYEISLLLNLYDAQNALKDHTYKHKDFVEFDLRERGKVRHIKSTHISDRVIQRCACDQVITPSLRKYLIYDNGASLEDRGVDYARRRLVCHLQRYYRKHGNKGYILLLDCSKFFDNLDHEEIKRRATVKLPEDCQDFFNQLIEKFEVDITGVPPEVAYEMQHGVYNSFEYLKYPKVKVPADERIMLKKSVGIGSQISQDCGVFLPTYVDNYVKIVRGMKFYGRYMDDSYIIHEDKEFLKQIRDELIQKYKDIGITINMKKTQICRIDKGFTWLQTKYRVTETGKIIRRYSHKNTVRLRRKLKSLKRKMENGVVPYEDIELMYKSCRGGIEKYDAHQTIRNLDQLYYELFGRRV